jgi:two-component system cell cycle sensor histidine kinase/response regulator CckA
MPYVLVTAACAGFAAFAAVHHLHIWWLSRQERISLLFAAFCTAVALFNTALVAAATATTIAGGQAALDARTSFGIIQYGILLWLIAPITGLRAKPVIMAATVVFTLGLLANVFVFSITGTVTAVGQLTLPWGESITALERRRQWVFIAAAVYATIFLVQVYAVVGARRLWQRDHGAGRLMAAAGIVGFSGLVLGLLVDLSVIRAPYTGQISSTMWVVLLAVLLSREYVNRGRQVQAGQQRFRAILDQTFQFIGLMSVDGRLLQANRTALQFAGLREEDVVGRLFWETPWWTHAPELQERLQDAVRRAAGGEAVRFEATHPAPDGRLAHVDFSLKPVFDEHGAVTLLIPEGHDITERKLAEESLRASEASLGAVIDNSPGVAIQWYDRDGRVVLWNRASEEMFGFTASEAIGKTLDQLIHTPEEFQEFLAALAEIGRTGQPIGPSEFTFRRGDAEHCVCLSTLFRVPSGDGDVRFVCMDVDITERKQAAQALAVSEARLRTLIESAPEAIVVVDVEQPCLTDHNAQACVLLGATSEQLMALDPAALSPAVQPDGRDSRAAIGAYLRQAVDGHAPVFEWAIRTLDGREIPCEVRLVRMPDPVRVLVRGSITDISGRLKLEEQLRQSQKMQAIGQLAGGVAHDFNNLLTVISGYSEILRKHLPEGDLGRDYIEAIQDASSRAAWLTDRLLSFSRRSVLAPQVIDINVVVRDAEGMLRRVIGEDVHLEVELHPAPSPVMIDSGQWSQVILNLAINARDAMPGGGRLTIGTGMIEADEPFVRNHPGLPAGRYAWLAVSDSGCGMSPEVMARIFEPFYTTKDMGKGTGLGLAVVHGIVSQAGGAIDVASQVGAGTTMTVYMPAAHELPAPTAGTATEWGAGAGETVLLVEDETNVRELVEFALASEGYVVLSASTGEEALQRIAAHGAAIDVLVTDVVMPGGMSGHQLGEIMRGKYPGLRTLYISGYVDDTNLGAGGFEAGEEFLQKPFALSLLTRKIRDLIDRPLNSSL